MFICPQEICKCGTFSVSWFLFSSSSRNNPIKITVLQRIINAFININPLMVKNGNEVKEGTPGLNCECYNSEINYRNSPNQTGILEAWNHLILNHCLDQVHYSPKKISTGRVVFILQICRSVENVLKSHLSTSGQLHLLKTCICLFSSVLPTMSGSRSSPGFQSLTQLKF